jgi:hypothetical protein
MQPLLAAAADIAPVEVSSRSCWLRCSPSWRGASGSCPILMTLGGLALGR